MKIGTDVNLSTCRAEGYLMMEFIKNKLLTKGVINKNNNVNFTATSGHLAWNDNGKLLPPKLRKTDAYIINVTMCWNDVYEIYKDRKDAIDRYAETDKYIKFDNPTEYDLLNLASDVNSYCGLE